MSAISVERDTLQENLHRYFGFDAFKLLNRMPG